MAFQAALEKKINKNVRFLTEKITLVRTLEDLEIEDSNSRRLGRHQHQR